MNQCLIHQKNLVHASYNKQFEKYDKLAREKGITILGEMGVDPGIDHMSAL
jgi:saccharopine dehydrogenase-like NADP-dependent oxidoreductase